MPKPSFLLLIPTTSLKILFAELLAKCKTGTSSNSGQSSHLVVMQADHGSWGRGRGVAQMPNFWGHGNGYPS